MLVRMTEDGRRLGTARIATEVERPAFVSLLRGLGSEGEAGLGKECLDEGGPVLDALEPVLDDDGEPVHVAGSGCGVGAQHHGVIAQRWPVSSIARTWSVKAAGFGATVAGESRSMDGTDRQSRSSASLTGAGASPGANVASNIKAVHSRTCSLRRHDRNRLTTIPPLRSMHTSCVVPFTSAPLARR